MKLSKNKIDIISASDNINNLQIFHNLMEKLQYRFIYKRLSSYTMNQ